MVLFSCDGSLRPTPVHGVAQQGIREARPRPMAIQEALR